MLESVPGDLGADTQQDEGNHAHHAMNGLARNPGCESRSIGIAEVDADTQQNYSSHDAQMRESRGEECFLVCVRAQRQRDYQRTWAGSDGEAEGIEYFLVERAMVSCCGRDPLTAPGFLLVQQSPAHRGHHQTSGNLHHGKRNAEETQNRCSREIDD